MNKRTITIMNLVLISLVLIPIIAYAYHELDVIDELTKLYDGGKDVYGLVSEDVPEFNLDIADIKTQKWICVLLSTILGFVLAGKAKEPAPRSPPGAMPPGGLG